LNLSKGWGSRIESVHPYGYIIVGSSNAKKILIPSLKCNNYVVGTKEIVLDRLIELAVEEIK